MSNQILEINKDGVCTISFNRAEVGNSFNAETIAELTKIFTKINTDNLVEIVVIKGIGKHFSAGADLNWMKQMTDYSEAENIADAKALADLLNLIANSPKIIIACVQGAAIGGAVGIIACCDLVVASNNAFFSFNEVRLGLAPAIISPHIIKVIGSHAAKRYFLTAEQFSAETALQLGLVHYVIELDKLDEKLTYVINQLKQAGSEALKKVKEIIQKIPNLTAEELIKYTTETIAKLRVSPEGQEGLKAFLEKREPSWRKAK